MLYQETRIPGVILVAPELREDDRGFFTRLYCQGEFAGRGLDFTPVQINLSGNQRRGTLRGLHYQKAPYSEAKLVRAVKGAVFDVAVDLRADSPTYGQWTGAELSDRNRLALLAPQGCAHGYLTLTEGAETLYLSGAPYQPEAEGGLRWNDPFCQIEWPFEPAVISEKDRNWPDYEARP